MKSIQLVFLLATLQFVSTPAIAGNSVVCEFDGSRLALQNIGTPLSERGKPENRTSGRVPHVQVDAIIDEKVNDQLRQLAFALPGVEKRPTVASLPGALGLWLSAGVPVSHPEAIVSGREFTHIHEDGSLHAPLPYQRAVELVEKGWGERHPWAERFTGWDGLVMLFSPRSSDELTVVFQLIVESYNHITGQNFGASDC